MHILIVTNLHLPCKTYGGIERVLWWLGKSLNALGHKVTYLAKKTSYSPFASTIAFNPQASIESQVPDDVDVVHINFPTQEKISKKPYLFTAHSIIEKGIVSNKNTVFISKEHARLNNSDVYVYHGLDSDEYGKPNLNNKRNYFHFLGKAKTPHKNLKGAIKTVQLSQEKLAVIGGNRMLLKPDKRFRITFDSNIKFFGMLGGNKKNQAINNSKGLIHPMRSFESFGLNMIESWYFGCPVFGTDYGSLKELIIPEVGATANNAQSLSEHLKQADSFNKKTCHEYVCDNFLSQHMAQNYIKIYEDVISGKNLHKNNPVSISYSEPLLPWG
jgi:glycosyltransferase involved in cell wall biosynthesis